AQVRHAQGAPPSEVTDLFATAHQLARSQGAHGVAARVADRAADVGLSVC
ncbi:MAG: hypothetical protein JWN99_1824, partial [Ilumatobacteraceae bacterium]|nr:hypothetical protein [Ilumatobacteraceae bacterium]